MNKSNVLNRVNSVLKADSITMTDQDFLLTHVPMNNLKLQKTFESNTDVSHGEQISEQQIFDQLVMNPNNLHQFIAVYGPSGTGKSHLIRWLKTELQRNKPTNEVIVFIRRSDNTLRGAMKQLLEIDEFKNSGDPNLIARLQKATNEMALTDLKTKIYYALASKVKMNERTNSDQLTRAEIRRLVAFLGDPEVMGFFLSTIDNGDGPLDRIASKIYSNDRFVDRDLQAEFVEADFEFEESILEKIQNTGNLATKRLCQSLLSDEENDLKRRIVSFLNSLIPETIQECTGIQNGDLRAQFHEIRKELKKQGKNLTIFIEDITSFSGVDQELLDVLMEEHTGEYRTTEYCRISSFVGTTNFYLEHHFNDNFRDRITNYIALKTEQFTEEDRAQLFARYMNAVSLTDEEINEWYQTTNDISIVPVHRDDNSNLNWEKARLNIDDEASLFPFNRRSIEKMYRYSLREGERTTRYLIIKILAPILREYLNSIELFPSQAVLGDASSIGYSQQIEQALFPLHFSENEKMRLTRFLKVWGNDSYMRTGKGNNTLIDGLPEAVFKMLHFPLPDFPEGESVPSDSKKEVVAGGLSHPKTVSEDSERIPTPLSQPKDIGKPKYNNKEELEQQRIYESLTIELNRWEQTPGYEIKTKLTSGTSGKARTALKVLHRLVLESINWESEGISEGFVKEYLNNKEFFFFEDSTANIGILPLHRNSETKLMIDALFRIVVFGKNTETKSWNFSYKDGLSDFQKVMFWINIHKSEIFQRLELVQTQKSLASILMTQKILLRVLNGGFTAIDLTKVEEPNLLISCSTISDEERSKHQTDWGKLADRLKKDTEGKKGKDNLMTLFDLPQGKSTINVLNFPEYAAISDQVRKELNRNGELNTNKLIISKYSAQTKALENLQYEVQEFIRISQMEYQQENNYLIQILEMIGQNSNMSTPKEIANSYQKFSELAASIKGLAPKIKAVNSSDLKQFGSMIPFETLQRNVQSVLQQTNVMKRMILQSRINLLELRNMVSVLHQIHANLDRAEFFIQTKSEIFKESEQSLDIEKSKNRVSKLSGDLDNLIERKKKEGI